MASKAPKAEESGQESAPLPLLQLPDPCLVGGQCCEDQRSLFNAARAHSRLRQAAALAMRSITVVVNGYKAAKQTQVDSMLRYLSKHPKHVGSVTFKGGSGPFKAP